MGLLSPLSASELADSVYEVQNEFFVDRFIKKRSELSQDQDNTQRLKAVVGTRLNCLIKAEDGFGVCAVGANNYSDDIFLIFRGSTNANNNADWISNFRIGVEISKTGLPVHIGFNQIFHSMFPQI